MANKKKNTARQRRKQAARAQPTPVETPDEEIVEEDSAKSSKAGSTKSEDVPARSWFGLGRFRRAKKNDEPEKEPWTRLQITVFILIVVVIQSVLAPIVVPNAASILDAALLFVGPQTLLGALFAQPIARRILHARALGVLETLTVGATLSLAAYFAQGLLVQPLITPSSSPSATATASPSPSSSQKASPSASPSPTAASTPSSTSTKPGPTPTAKPSTHPCPVDDPNCNQVIPTYELETAQGMSDAVGVILAITFYPIIHRFFWMPKLRAKRREERNKKAAAKSKKKSK